MMDALNRRRKREVPVACDEVRVMGSPRWRRLPTMLAIGIGMVAIFLSGCSAIDGITQLDRVNHWHSETNQKTAEKALAAFDEFSSDRTGLEATLLKNLSTQSAHHRDLNTLRIDIDETDMTIGLTKKSWNELRNSLYSSLGVMDSGREKNDRATTPDYVRWQLRVDVGIKTRYRKIQAVGAVLKALALGQEAMIIQAKANVDRAIKNVERQQAVANGSMSPAAADRADKADKTANERAAELVETLFGFRTAVIAAGKEATDLAKRRSDAESLQKEILAAVDRSRDPASAYALVAMIGTGLGAESAEQLDHFINTLTLRLDGIPIPDASKGVWKEYGDAASEAKRLVELAQVLPEVDKLRNQAQPAGAAIRDLPGIKAAAEKAEGKSKKQAIEDLKKAELAATLAVATAPDRVSAARTLAEKLKALKLQIPEKPKTEDAGMAKDRPDVESFLIGVEVALAPLFSDGKDVDSIAELLEQIGGRLPKEIQEFRELIDRLPPSILGKELNELLAALKAPGATDATKKEASLDYLQKLLASNPALIRQIEKIKTSDSAEKRFDAELKQLASVVSQINTQQVEAVTRVLEFLRDLYRLQLNLHEENLRHYRALSAVAVEELRRWRLLSRLNTRYRYGFSDVRTELQRLDALAAGAPPAAFPPGEVPAGGAGTAKPAVGREAVPRDAEETAKSGGDSVDPRLPTIQYKLFTTNLAGTDHAKIVEYMKKGLPANPPAKDAPVPSLFEDVDYADPILHTLRLLSETASFWQFGSPASDSHGARMMFSFGRLREAIELINGQILMISVNERFSLENGLVLRTELQEHDLHLDAIASRTHEAGLRLGLRDLVAFHSTGVTEGDIQAAIGIVQQLFLYQVKKKI